MERDIGKADIVAVMAILAKDDGDSEAAEVGAAVRSVCSGRVTCVSSFFS